MNLNPAFARPATAASRSSRPRAAPRVVFMFQPVVVAWLVMAVATLSFYVHLLNEQVERGQKLRATQLTESGQPLLTPAAHPPLRVANRAFR